MAPRVLIADKLSPAAVDIFRAARSRISRDPSPDPSFTATSSQSRNVWAEIDRSAAGRVAAAL